MAKEALQQKEAADLVISSESAEDVISEPGGIQDEEPTQPEAEEVPVEESEPAPEAGLEPEKLTGFD